MIQYSLVCENEHGFEAWFKSASAYDDQVKMNVVTCPICATPKVEKALMAPSLGRKSNREGPGAKPSAEEKSSPDSAVSLTAGHPDHTKLRQAMRQLRDKIVSEADYVGDKFAQEARKIHDDESDARSIYGEATADETASLIEDGVDILPLPTLPEEQN